MKKKELMEIFDEALVVLKEAKVGENELPFKEFPATDLLDIFIKTIGTRVSFVKFTNKLVEAVEEDKTITQWEGDTLAVYFDYAGNKIDDVKEASAVFKVHYGNLKVGKFREFFSYGIPGEEDFYEFYSANLSVARRLNIGNAVGDLFCLVEHLLDGLSYYQSARISAEVPEDDIQDIIYALNNQQDVFTLSEALNTAVEAYRWNKVRSTTEGAKFDNAYSFILFVAIYEQLRYHLERITTAVDELPREYDHVDDMLLDIFNTKIGHEDLNIFRLGYTEQLYFDGKLQYVTYKYSCGTINPILNYKELRTVGIRIIENGSFTF